MRTSPLRSFVANSQGLSPKALKAKRARDLAAAKTPIRKAKKADGSVEKVSVKDNRCNFGKGTRT